MTDQELHHMKHSLCPRERAMGRLLTAGRWQARCYAWSISSSSSTPPVQLMASQRQSYQEMEDARLVLQALDTVDERAALLDQSKVLRLIREELEMMSGYWTEQMDTLAQMADQAINKKEITA